MTLVFATGNAHKVKEVNAVFAQKNVLQIKKENVNVVSMKDIGCFDDIPETTGTIKGNALQKAHYLYEKYNVDFWINFGKACGNAFIKSYVPIVEKSPRRATNADD